MVSTVTAQQSPDELTLMRALVDAVPDPIFCKDPEGRYTLSNRAHTARWTRSGEGLIGRTVFDVPGLREHAAEYHADDVRVMRDGETIVNHEEPFVGRDGAPGWYLTSKFPLRSAAGEITGMVGIARDITQRKAAERRLAEERTFLKTLTDAIPDLISFKDRA